MEVIVRGKHFQVPPPVEERARRKFSKLSHYLPRLADAAVEVDLVHEKAKEPDERYVVRVTVSGPGIHLHAEERAAQPETAVDQAAHALTRQAERHKERLYARKRQRSPRAVRAALEPAAPEPERPERVGRIKRLALKPMTISEALEQMEGLGHDFFIYHDADEEGVAILYRRRAGDFGLIIPELS